MNKLLVLACLILVSCSKKESESLVSVSGRVTGLDIDYIHYTNPEKGTHFLLFRDSTAIDSKGAYTFEIPLEDITFITVHAVQDGAVITDKMITIAAEPNEHYEINFDYSKPDKEHPISIVSKNQSLQRLYNQFSNAFHPQETIGPFYNDTSAIEIRSKINTSLQKEIAQLDSLQNIEPFSDDLYNYIKLDRDFFYATQQATVGFVKLVINQRQQGSFNEGIKDMWNEALSSNLLSDPNFQRTASGYYLAENKVFFENYKTVNFDLNAFNKRIEDVSYFTYLSGSFEKHLDPTVQEFVKAHYLIMETMQKEFQYEMVELYSDYENDYPNSPYLKYLKPQITEIEGFHKKAKESFGPDIEFVSNYEQITTLDELLDQFKGKNIYMDVWGTWCGPCKKEFKEKEKIKDLLASKDIVSLYICESRSSKKDAWENMIKYYELDGYHVYANKQLMADIIEKLGKAGSFYYPYYALIDKNGSISTKEAAKPSQQKLLKKQVNSL